MPLSPFNSQKFVGLDIGHSTIKLAQVEKQGHSFRVVAWASVPTPPDSVNDGVVTDPDAVADAIKTAIRENRITASSVNLAVAGASVVVRTVKMPVMPEAALRKSIRFEAGRYVPSSVEESYIEFEIVGQSPDAQMQVLIAASPKDRVESKVVAAQRAGLQPEIVDVEPFALYRTLVEADDLSQADTQTVALIDLGGENTQVSVVDQGAFALTRNIPIGGHALSTALEKYFKMSEEDAEIGKRSLDLTPLIHAEGPMENPPLRVVQPLVDELVREIRRSLNYFQSQQTDQGHPNAVSHLLLSGGGSLLGGLPAYLSHKLNIEVSAPNPFDNPNFIIEGLDDPAASRSLTVALGLGLRRPQKAVLAA
jgi:type IV pilus assembly protein PilM